MKKAVAGLDPIVVTELLRSGVLAIKPAEIGLTLEECPKIWGVLLELGYPEVVVSLVALIDGSVSIYSTDGNGVIGCGLHPEVRAATCKMLNIAQDVAHCGVPTTDFPMPANDGVFFYLLTSQGVCVARAGKMELEEGEIELAELYYAAMGLIDIVELLGAGVDIIDEMRLAEYKLTQEGTGVDMSGAVSLRVANDSKARGRACRILPYVGSAARRSHN